MAVELRKSACNRDCPDACVLEAEVENERIVRLRGDPDHPVTRGFLCFRTSHFPSQLEREGRVTTPLLRRDGQLVPVSWETALDHAAAKLGQIRAESGPASIFHYRSGGSLGLLKGVADLFFECFGPCTIKSGDICSGAGEAAQNADFGISESNDLFDLRNSRQVILWGKNPTVSSVHLVPLLKEIRQKGAEVGLIDPVHHRGASLADWMLQPRPGRDAELALGVLRALDDRGALLPENLERCHGSEELIGHARTRSLQSWAQAADLAPRDLEGLAERFCAGPTAILVGWGMQRRGRGAAIVRALDALAALSGNLWCSGGGSSFYFGRRRGFDESVFGSGAAARRIPEPLFGPEVLAAKSPSIRALWVTAGNPICTLPESSKVAEAIDATEFVVVVDPLLTDTAKRADLVLPVPSLLEDSDLLGSYGHHWLAESRPLVAPPTGVLHETQIFKELAARLQIEGFELSVDEWKQRALRPSAECGVDLAALRKGAQRNPAARQVVFGDGKTHRDDGKVQLLSPQDLAVPESEDVDFPLWLFSNSVEKSQGAQWAKDPGEHLTVTVHPDAVPPELKAGDRVRLVSAIAEIELILAIDPKQRPDVAVVPKGGHHSRGQAINALIRARATDQGLGAAYLDARVRLEAE